MKGPFHIVSGVSRPERKGGRPKQRAVAVEAANAIRERKFNSIYKAAEEYYPKHIEYMGYDRAKDENGFSQDGMKDFIKYIAEELENGPKSMHVFRVLSERSNKPRAKGARKQRFLKQFYEEVKRILTD